MSLVAFFAVAASCAWLGWRLAAWAADEEQDRAERWTLRLVAGTAALHVLLTALQAAGVRWSRWSVGAAALLAGVALLLPRRGRETRRPPVRVALGWGDVAALAALAVFTVLAVGQQVTISDFVYHWGLKGERFLVFGGVDTAFLARPWNWALHPDYPNLVPELYALTGLAAGRFAPPAMMAWSVLFLAMTLAGVRGALRRGLEERALRQAGLAAFAGLVVAFAVGERLAGGADLALAVVLPAAWPALAGAPDRAKDWRVGLLAAFAAACKMEGVALAAILVAVYLVRRARASRATLGAAEERSRAPGGWRAFAPGGWRAFAPAALRVALPALIVVLPWLVVGVRHGLFLPTNTGRFDAGRAGVVAAAAWRVLGESPWHGAAFAVALLPWLLLRRDLRAYAAACLLQLGFYLFIYFSAPTDTEFHISVSFARLLLHVVPGTLVATLVGAERWLAAAGGAGAAGADGRIAAGDPA